jgi:hypothetical protein
VVQRHWRYPIRRRNDGYSLCNGRLPCLTFRRCRGLPFSGWA